MKFFFILLLSLPILLSAQVVNTEKMRIHQENSGITGEVDLSLGLTRNKAGQTLRIGSSTRLEWKRHTQRWLILGGYNRTQFTNVDVPGSAPKNFANNAFGHLRYNLDLTPLITWEAFVQTQYDEIQEIDIRTLAGTGPRLRIVEKDTLHLFVGVIYMYEYEKTSEQSTLVFNRDHRLSNYLSIGFQPTHYLSVNHVTYYQPNISRFPDFRISSETTMDIRLSTKLALRTYLQFVYDEKPPVSVPKTMYMLTHGITWKF